MEDVLDLYAEPFQAWRPVVCFDERPVQLLSDTRDPLPMSVGRSLDSKRTKTGGKVLQERHQPVEKYITTPYIF